MCGSIGRGFLPTSCKRVRDDMALRGIVCTAGGFAEQAIYADLMKERNTT